MHNLINNFSPTTLQDFFKTKVSSFKPLKENLNQILRDNNFEQFTELTKLGEIDFKGVEDLLVFACKSNTVLTERSAKKKQFEIAKKVLKEDDKDGAIFVFYDASGNFRFSFLRKNYGNAAQKFTAWKRYTYYVEKDKTNKTFKDRVGNANFSSLDTLQKAFSVEKLTEDFYKELFAWYQWILSEEIGVTFPNNTETSDDDRVKLEEQIIRLITRLLFVWFIKQKKLVPNNLFATENLKTYLTDFDANSKTEGTYYNAILQNLFFATLNKEIDGRAFSKLVKERDIKTFYRYAEMFSISETEILTLFNQVPFLNGGLFECLDKTVKMNGTNQVLDGFSKNATKSANGNFKHRAFIPNCVFFDEKKGIIPLLERYNFTVEENAPNEIQVALDPELLGNVFENLLGAFNPETKETARKQSGSFYTPREIVSYMVDESLIFYLLNAFPQLKEENIRELFTAEELPIDFTQNHPLCEEISLKLKEIKILDPACGSGAFPMGILNRMVAVLEKLACHKEKSVYDLKLHLIEECIYGVDIQTIAVQISKLRFFISLIVEEDNIDLTKKEDNYGILTLPNLETKFVAANTLIGLASANKNMLNLNDKALETMKTQLWEVRKQHFYAKSASEKKRLRIADEKLRDEIKDYISANASKPNTTFTKQLQTEITQLEKKRKNFEGELWVDDTTKQTQVTMFDSGASNPSIFKIDKNLAERKKIDVTIKALQTEIAKEQNKALNVGFEKEIETIAKWNPYDQNTSSPFFDVEWMFGLKSESADAGCFDVVIGNPPYGAKLLNKRYYKELFPNSSFGTIDSYKYFIDKGVSLAKTDGSLCYITSDSYLEKEYFIDIRKLLLKKSKILKNVKLGDNIFENVNLPTAILFACLNESEKQILVESADVSSFPAFEKISNISVSTRTVSYENDINLAFLSNSSFLNKLSGRRLVDLYHQIMGVKIYQTGKGFPKQTGQELANNIFISDTKKADGNWIKFIDSGVKKYHFDGVLKYINYGKWLAEPRNYSFFSVPKILIREVVNPDVFSCYIEEECVVKNTNAVIIQKSEHFKLKFLLAIINSNLFTHYVAHNSPKSSNKSFPSISSALIKNFPVIEAELRLQEIFIREVDIIFQNIKVCDEVIIPSINRLNNLVYKLYELTYEEVLIIEPGFTLSKSEYDNFKIEA